MSTYKQAIIIRRDLKLKRAEFAALASKASAQFLIENDESERSNELHVKLGPQEAEWLYGGGKRIILGVNSETALKSLVMKAELFDIPTTQVFGAAPRDSDKFNSEQLLCCVLGPDAGERIDQITASLKLL